MKDAVIFDIDGVLAMNAEAVKQRAHEILEAGEDITHPDSWAEHNARIQEWPAHEGWSALARTLHQRGVITIMLTNRPESLRNDTWLWLTARNIPCDVLVMFQDGHEYYASKRAALKVLRERYNVVLAVDDSRGHCSMYEEEGLPSIHVNNHYPE